MNRKTVLSITFCLLLTMHLTTLADTPLLTGKSAMGDFSADVPGVRRVITVADSHLPLRDALRSRNGFHSPRRPDGVLPKKAPPGFTVDLLAAGLGNPRKSSPPPTAISLSPKAIPTASKSSASADGTIASNTVFAADLTNPLASPSIHPARIRNYVYIANTDSVVRFPYQNGDLKAAAAPEMIVPDIPGGGRLPGGGHWTRDVVFSPDGTKMFVSVGSHSNVNDDAAENTPRRYPAI